MSTVMPAAPRTLEATGLPFDLVHQLVLKTLHLTGELTGNDLAARLGVVFSVIEPCLDLLRRERHCQAVGGTIGPSSSSYRLTDVGHDRAATYVGQNPYVGKLPVPLNQYTEYMQTVGRQSMQPVTHESVRRAFSHLVLSDRVLDQLGPGIAARHSLFVYGPPGNGKTAIAHSIIHLLGGDIAIPHALAVDTEVIGLYDPLSHFPVDVPEAKAMLARERLDDARWVRCRRPVVTVGGELRLEALELGYSAHSGLYRAPLQVLSNGGVLVIDDFGRQRASPREILNRWIVPLESRTDHLVLRTGQKFELPFESLIVFATNLNPLDLLDESFLRRIRYKVYAESPTKDEFFRIFENCCRERSLHFDRALVEQLVTNELEPRHVHLRGCQPRDLIDHALSLAEYAGVSRELEMPRLSAACATYFLTSEPAASN
jgi:predicted ATPase with chaperone activity